MLPAVGLLFNQDIIIDITATASMPILALFLIYQARKINAAKEETKSLFIRNNSYI
jgi:hypothetical protein